MPIDTPGCPAEEFPGAGAVQDADDNEVEEVSKRLLERNAAVYRELAK